LQRSVLSFYAMLLLFAGNGRAQAPQASAPAAAAPTGTAAPTAATCANEHERSQLLRNEGKLIQQREALRACSDQACPGIIRADCTTWLVEVEGKLPTLVFAAESSAGDEPDVRVFMDGRLLTERLDGKSIVVDPGVHDFRFELARFPPKQLRALVREGEKERVIAVRFDEAPPTTPAQPPPPVQQKEDKPVVPGERPVPVVVYVLGGVAVVGAASATYFGLSMLKKRDDALDTCAPFCSQERVDEVKQTGLVADVSLGVAVVSAGAALYFYFTRPEVARASNSAPATAFVPDLALVPHGGTLGMRGTF
jgi:hypothetical protein